MKIILVILLFCLFHLEKAEEEQSIQEFGHHGSIQAPAQARNDDTVRKNRNVRKKHEKVNVGDSKRKRSNQIRRREERRQNKNKNGLKTKVGKKFTKNMKRQNKERKREKEIRKRRKQKKRQHISRKQINTEKKDTSRIKQRKWMKKNKKGKKEQKRNNKLRKQRKRMKKNKRAKKEQKRSNKLMKKIRRTKQMKKMERNKKSKKEKNRSNKLLKQKEDGRVFYGPNGNNGGKNVQEFECDIYGYTRDFSVALTQVNRVKRILNKPGRIDGLATTDFSVAITALGAATQGGTRCYGSDTTYNNFMSRLIYDQLQSCQADLPRICNTSRISGYDPESTTNGMKQWQQCKGRLERFVKGYRRSIFKDPGEKYEKVCPNMGNSWNSNGTGLMADANASNSAGKNIPSPDTPLELWRDGCLPNTFAKLDGALQARFAVCKDPGQLTSGSHGSCMAFLTASLLYVDLCNPLPPMFSTLTSFYTWATARAVVLQNIIENLIYLRPFRSIGRSYGFKNNATDGSSTLQAKVDLNFTSIVDMMRGTNCTDKAEYDILSKCPESIPEICSAKLLDDKWAELGGDSCQQMIEDFTKDYELITDNTAIQPGSNGSRQPLNRDDGFSSFISGYNLPLIANCIPRYCFENEQCYPENYNYKVSTLEQLKEQFFISFELKSVEGPPATDKSHTLIQFLDTNQDPVLSLSVVHNQTEANSTKLNTILNICSYTFEGENNCKELQNVFTADKWHHIEFSQALENEEYSFQVNIDGSKKIKENGIQPKIFSNIQVSTATDDNTVKASFRNMFINTKGAKTEDLCKVTLKHATSSSVYVNDNATYGPLLAIDGNFSTSDGNFFRSKYEDYPWLQIQLSSPTNVSDVTIVNSRYGFKRWFTKAVIRAGTATRGARVCGTFEGPAAFGATINIECDTPIMAEYVTVQLNYTGAILAVDEVKVNSQQSVRNEHIHLNELMDNMTKAGCLKEKYTDLDANIETTVSTCFNATVKGSYGSCDAARTTAYSYVNSCVRPTTPTSSLVTNSLRQRIQLLNKKKLLVKKNIK